MFFSEMVNIIDVKMSTKKVLSLHPKENRKKERKGGAPRLAYTKDSKSCNWSSLSFTHSFTPKRNKKIQSDLLIN